MIFPDPKFHVGDFVVLKSDDKRPFYEVVKVRRGLFHCTYDLAMKFKSNRYKIKENEIGKASISVRRNPNEHTCSERL